VLGTLDAGPGGGPTSFAAPFIQAGTYSFFVSTSAL